MTHAPRTVGGLLLATPLAVLALAGCAPSTPATSTTGAPTTLQPTATDTASASASATSASPSPTKASPKPSPSGPVTYTLAQVKQHDSAASCWSVVDKKVYDLTKWVSRHPGGRARILSMCGRDGTAIFRNEHGHESRPNQILAGYLLGKYAG